MNQGKELIESFCRDNEPSIRALVNGADEGCVSERDFIEYGRILLLVDGKLVMGESFSQRLSREDRGDGVYRDRIERHNFSMPTVWELWLDLLLAPNGLIHTHPSKWEWMDFLSPSDHRTFDQIPGCDFMLMATRAGTGRLHVVARWREADGMVKDGGFELEVE